MKELLRESWKPRKSSFVLNCPTCGRPFIVHQWQKKRGHGKYCSWGCRKRPEIAQKNKTIFRRKRIASMFPADVKIPSESKPKPVKSRTIRKLRERPKPSLKLNFCVWCGKIKQTLYKGGKKGSFCTRECYNELVRLIKRRGVYSSGRKPLPHAFKKGSVPWNKGIKGCHSEEALTKIRAARALQIVPIHDTSIETKMKEELERREISYEHAYSLHGKFRLDFAFPEHKLAVECDGIYWHSLPRSIANDKRKEKYIDRVGWKLLRFTDECINTSVGACVDVIMRTLGVVV